MTENSITNPSTQETLINNLSNPKWFDHKTDSIHVRETHISWLILTGPFAYKVKKAVDLDFADFTTLEKREHYCREELRLNRRFTPELYKNVLPITGSPQKPLVGKEGDPIEWCLKMKQFPKEDHLPRKLKSGDVRLEQIIDLAIRVAKTHNEIDTAKADSDQGTPTEVHQAVEQNFDQMYPLIDDQEILDRLNQLRSWSEAHFQEEYGWFERRKLDGYIRECHGDMHLKNMFVENQDIKLFDCLEFNEDLRWIDVMNDLACLLVDLDIHDKTHWGHRFLNTYLNWSGDYEGVAVLRFYRVYRAMVRAKISLMSHHGDQVPEIFYKYLEQAEQYVNKPQPFLAITRGPSASGKSTITDKLIDRLNLIRLQSDVIRKQIHDMDPDEKSHSDLNENLYTEQANRRTYEILAEYARLLLQAGYPVIVDASFLDKDKRHNFRELALSMNIPFHILNFDAPEDILRERIRERSDGETPSEARLEVLEYQLDNGDPLTDEEQQFSRTIDSTDDIDINRFLNLLT